MVERRKAMNMTITCAWSYDKMEKKVVVVVRGTCWEEHLAG